MILNLSEVDEYRLKATANDIADAKINHKMIISEVKNMWYTVYQNARKKKKSIVFWLLWFLPKSMSVIGICPPLKQKADTIVTCKPAEKRYLPSLWLFEEFE